MMYLFINLVRIEQCLVLIVYIIDVDISNNTIYITLYYNVIVIILNSLKISFFIDFIR